MSDDDNLFPPPDWPEIVRRMRARTPARIFVVRGAAYSTGMQLELRQARASAVDAVWNEFDLNRDFPFEFVTEWKLFEVSTQAETKPQFLLRPDLGRRACPQAMCKRSEYSSRDRRRSVRSRACGASSRFTSTAHRPRSGEWLV